MRKLFVVVVLSISFGSFVSCEENIKQKFSSITTKTREPKVEHKQVGKIISLKPEKQLELFEIEGIYIFKDYSTLISLDHN